MAKFKDYYKILGLPSFSDLETVKLSYRKLARKYHPDLNGGNKKAEERFKEINEAYDALNGLEKKKAYDNSLQIMMQGGKRSNSGQGKARRKTQEKAQEKTKTKRQSPSAKSTQGTGKKEKKSVDQVNEKTTPVNELFESFLKRGFASEKKVSERKGASTKKTFKDASSKSKRAKSRKGENVTVETAITPFEAEQGVVKTVNVQHNELCKRCSATGRVNGLVCTACNGEKRLVRLKKLDVRIPAGVKEGSKVRVAGEGGRGASGADDGDLFLLIKVDVNSALRIEGLDVYCDFSLAIPDAVLGAEVDVPTLDGTVKMTIPAHTSSGKVFRLKGMGAKNGQNRGDQYVTVQIVSPESLSPKEKMLYEELAKLARTQQKKK